MPPKPVCRIELICRFWYLVSNREALEAGPDPAVVARWIAEVQADRRAAEEELRRRRPSAALTEADIREMVESLGDLVRALEAPEPAKKAALYEVSDWPSPTNRASEECCTSGSRRCTSVRVGGPWRTSPTPLVVRGELYLAA